MKYNISEESCLKYNTTLPEVLAMMLIKSTDSIDTLFKDMLMSQKVVIDSNNNYYITQRWNDVLSSVLLDSESSIDTEEHLNSLVKALMQIFPKGKKEGTNVYWRGNLKDNKLRLKKFFKLYGDRFSDEKIIEATRNYVSSFNGNYSYMRVLKYFIWKDTKKIDSEGKGYVEETSELATLLENEGQDNINQNWTTNLL